MPRFDSGSCFASLLDDERGGACTLEVPGGALRPLGSRYLDATLVHEARLAAPGGELRVLDALVPGDGPRRLVRVVEATSGRVEVTTRVAARFDYGEVRPWVRVRGDHRAAILGGNDAIVIWTDRALARDGDHDVLASATLEAGERLRVVLAWMAPEAALDAPVPHDPDADLEASLAWWRAWCGRIDGPAAEDPALRHSAIVLRALVYDRTGAVVAAPTTSLPESPEGTRTWDYRYAWVRDATFACRSLADVGAGAVGEAFARFVMRSAAGHVEDLQVLFGVGGERRIREEEVDLAGWRGAQPVRVGNAAAGQVQRDEPGEILRQCRHLHERGHVFDDDEWRFLVSLVDHVAAHWRDPDRGFWEWRGDPRHFVHSKAACFAALDAGVHLAQAT